MNAQQVVAIECFMLKLQEAVTKDEKRFTAGLFETKITSEYGRKYARIVRTDKRGSHAVHCFIEIASGDIYKAATWAAPAKHVRGNINTRDCGMSAVSVYSANYMR